MHSCINDNDIPSLRKKFGYNEIKQKQTPVALIFLKHFWGLTAWMLELTVVISFLLHKTIDAWVILSLLIVNGLIGFYNELKSIKAVAALQEQLQVTVRVLRNKNWVRLPSRELLPGDVVRIRTGDFVSADMEILSGKICVDKSALTGETALKETNIGDILYSGSIVKSGECMALVTTIASNTYFGKTASLVLTAKHKIQMETVVVKVVRVLFASVIVILSLTTLAGVLNGQNIFSILPLSLILLVSAVPVGLPAMFTISMARGSKELARDGLLVTNLSATEDAATLTTLCIDKTGTLTKNELSLQHILSTKEFTEEEVIVSGSLASVKANNDTIDLAFISEAERRRIPLSEFHQVSFQPFDSVTKLTKADITSPENSHGFSVAKGAYNAILNLCGVSVSEFDSTVEQWAEKGFKTIAISINQKNKWELVGIVALYDTPRSDARVVLNKLKELGIKVKMLTGDALPIGREIASQVGIGNNIISIADIRITENDYKEGVIYRYDGFTEVLPQDKYNLVKELQHNNEIVGMTGDGVNDAPALKQAEVGIAVKSATDVAKQAASVILFEDGLSHIISLIKTGRSIHTRIVNYTINKIAKTIQTILFVCIAYVITGQFVVTTIDMVILLFLIDFVVLALSVDITTGGKTPANWNMKPILIKGFTIGFMLFAECIFWYFFSSYIFNLHDESQLHSLGFTCLFYSTLLVIPVIRTDKRFYQQPISTTLLFILIADAILVFALLLIGFKDFAILPYSVVSISVLYFLLCNLFINDTIKLFVSRKLY